MYKVLVLVRGHPGIVGIAQLPRIKVSPLHLWTGRQVGR